MTLPVSFVELDTLDAHDEDDDVSLLLITAQSEGPLPRRDDRSSHDRRRKHAMNIARQGPWRTRKSLRGFVVLSNHGPEVVSEPNIPILVNTSYRRPLVQHGILRIVAPHPPFKDPCTRIVARRRAQCRFR